MFPVQLTMATATSDQLERIRHGRLGVTVLLALFLAMAGVGGLATDRAEAAPAVLSFKAVKLPSPPGVRKARITVSNTGGSLGCDPLSLGCETVPARHRSDPSTSFYSAYMFIELALFRAKTNGSPSVPNRGVKVTSSRTCHKATGRTGKSRQVLCYVDDGKGTWLAAGRSWSMSVSFPASIRGWSYDSLHFGPTIQNSSKWQWGVTPPADGLRWDNAKPNCTLSVPGSQKLDSREIVIKVEGKPAGCKAALKKVALAVDGKAKWTAKPGNERQVGKGETWRSSFVYSIDQANELRKLARAGRKVTAQVTATLNGQSVTKSTVLKP